MARRRKREEHDDRDRWLISYADFITLLFAFFVVMYAISSVNEGKYKVFSSSLNTAFNGAEASSSVPATQTEQNQRLMQELTTKRDARIGEEQRKIQESMQSLANSLSRAFAPLMQQDLVSVNVNRRGITIDVSASVLFRTAEANLQPDTLVVLGQVAQILSRETHTIEIEGHSDDVPIATPLFPSNWELSSARASSVARFMIANGVQSQRLSVVGLAENHPLVPNNTLENRARNRRVSITIVSPNVERK